MSLKVSSSFKLNVYVLSSLIPQFVFSWFLGLIACAICSFLMDWTMIIIAECETFNYIFSYTLNFFFFTLYSITAFYCISSLTLPTVSSKISLFFTLYASSFFKPFILLWSLPKYFLLLKSLT